MPRAHPSVDLRLHLCVGDCGLSLCPGPSWHVRALPLSSHLILPELRKHADTAQRFIQMSAHVSPCSRPPSNPHVTHILTAAPSIPPLTHHLLLLASSPSISASPRPPRFLKHTEQASDLRPLHSCMWLMPSSPSHLCLKYMFTNVHSSIVHNC